jgi:hypothetical protein
VFDVPNASVDHVSWLRVLQEPLDPIPIQWVARLEG